MSQNCITWWLNLLMLFTITVGQNCGLTLLTLLGYKPSTQGDCGIHGTHGLGWMRSSLGVSWWIILTGLTYMNILLVWFGTCFIFHNIWDVILPIDELIFFKMVKTTNQYIYIIIYIYDYIYIIIYICTNMHIHLNVHTDELSIHFCSYWFIRSR